MIIYKSSHTEKETKLYQLSKRVLIKLIIEARLKQMCLEDAKSMTFNDWVRLNNETHDFECIIGGLINILEKLNSEDNNSIALCGGIPD